MSNITNAIREFDATDANLKKLEEFWAEIQDLIPDDLIIDNGSKDAIRYVELCRKFGHILKALPAVGGLELQNELMELDEVFQNRFDALELGEIEITMSVDRAIYAQGDSLKEYRFRLSVERRALVRNALSDCVASIDSVLSDLASQDCGEPNERISLSEWDSLVQLVAQIEVLRGSAIPPPPHWGALKRHMHFGLCCDLSDIVNHDWPSVRDGLMDSMYGPDDPIPVSTKDLSEIGRTAPSGAVVTALNWQVLNAESFERVVFNIISDAETYSNTQWLTCTNAPDRGRDISAIRSVDDPLSGTRTYRVLIQCKHWKKSINIGEVKNLLMQMKLWEPPCVDELVIATSGRFTTDAVAFIEQHNNGHKHPTIYMWPESHLESLLASRSHIVAKFDLR
ncbi:MAG: restriction endonuclease [Planctomycetota bacterium]